MYRCGLSCGSLLLLAFLLTVLEVGLDLEPEKPKLLLATATFVFKLGPPISAFPLDLRSARSAF
jgi:hypothetical protein